MAFSAPENLHKQLQQLRLSPGPISGMPMLSGLLKTQNASVTLCLLNKYWVPVVLTSPTVLGSEVWRIQDDTNIYIYILNYIYTDNTVSQAENSRRGANKMVLNDCMAVLGSLSLDLLLRCYSYSSSGTGSGDTQLGLTWIDIGLWVNQCHKPPIWEWFRHVYTTYQNGDD